MGSNVESMWRAAVAFVTLGAALIAISGVAPEASARQTDYRELVFGDDPVAYWRLGDLAGTRAADEAGNLDGFYVGNP